MKTWKRVALALGIASVLGGASAAIAANAHRRGDFQQGFMNHVNRMLDKINATQDQRNQITAIANQTISALKAQRPQNANPHADAMSILTASSADEMTQAVNNAQAHSAARAEAMQKATPVIINALQQVHDILTPAQRQQLADLAKNHAAMRGGFGGPQQ
jgi:Spy/CpxP family protein refolding chaperone